MKKGHSSTCMPPPSSPDTEVCRSERRRSIGPINTPRPCHPNRVSGGGARWGRSCKIECGIWGRGKKEQGPYIHACVADGERVVRASGPRSRHGCSRHDGSFADPDVCVCACICGASRNGLGLGFGVQSAGLVLCFESIEVCAGTDTTSVSYPSHRWGRNKQSSKPSSSMAQEEQEQAATNPPYGERVKVPRPKVSQSVSQPVSSVLKC